jgi:hypothetical protein
LNEGDTGYRRLRTTASIALLIVTGPLACVVSWFIAGSDVFELAVINGWPLLLVAIGFGVLERYAEERWSGWSWQGFITRMLSFAAVFGGGALIGNHVEPRRLIYLVTFSFYSCGYLMPKGLRRMIASRTVQVVPD